MAQKYQWTAYVRDSTTTVMNGYIKLPRSFFSSPIIDSAEAFRLCCYLYANADESGRIEFGSGDAKRKFGISRQQYRTIVNLLEATNTATIITTNKVTNIMFCETNNSKHKFPSRQPTQQPPRQPTITSKISSDALNTSTKFPFVDPMFEDAFSTWLEYKEKQWHFKYKTERSLKSAYQELVRLSECDPCAAMRIVEQSMSNGWKGLFELKEQYGTTKRANAANDHASRAESRRRMSALATEIISRSENLLNLYNGQGTDPDNRQN